MTMDWQSEGKRQSERTKIKHWIDGKKRPRETEKKNHNPAGVVP